MICKKCGATILDNDLFNHKCSNSLSDIFDDNTNNNLNSIFLDNNDTSFSDKNTIELNNNNIFLQDSVDNDKDKSINFDSLDKNVQLDNSIFNDNNSTVNDGLLIQKSVLQEDNLTDNSVKVDNSFSTNNNIFLQDSIVSDKDKSVNDDNSSNTINLNDTSLDNNLLFYDNLSNNEDINTISSLNKNGHSLFVTIFVLFAFACILGVIFLFRSRLFGSLTGDNFNRSEDCRITIKNAYKEYVNLYGDVVLKDGTCIIITSSVKKISFKISSDTDKIIEFRDGKFYQDSIAEDNYELAISYSKDDMDALKKDNNVLINSFYFNSSEILK